ncbi:SWIM zinc finger protein [Breznakia blatticola]|uniref:SWIM zinc finger protein n=2 Tax=Breznakia blatticola TaxID=1754012 RepID=A0A4R7ZH03_9FIRM|nr:SWIM zinc finger protein [Breznakia blatticola]
MWKDAFDYFVCKRGRAYFNNGYVDAIEKQDTLYHARVYGTKVYNTMIEVSNNEIVQMKCSCPHFQSGNNCKHLVAVILEVCEKEDILENQLYIRASKKKEHDYLDRLKSFSFQTFDAYQLKKLAFDNQTYDFEPTTDFQELLNRIEDISDGYTDYYDDYIDDQDSEVVIDLAYEEIEASVLQTLKSKDILKTYEILWEGLRAICILDTIDSNNYKKTIQAKICELIYVVIKEANDIEKKVILKSLGNIEGSNHIFLDDTYRISLILDAFDNILLEERESVIRNAVDVYLKQGMSQHYQDNGIPWLIALNQIIKRKPNGTKNNDIFELYSDFECVLVYQLEQILQSDKKTDVFAFIDKNKSKPQFMSMAVKYNDLIKSIYLDNRKEHDYYELLRCWLVDYNIGDYTMYHVFLKQVSPLWWKTNKRKFIEKLDFDGIARVYKQEGYHDLLFAYAKKIDQMDQYVEILVPYCTNDLITYYEERFIELSTPPAKIHNPIIHALEMLRKIPGGTQKVYQLIVAYLEMYPGRKILNAKLREIKEDIEIHDELVLE